MGREAGIMERVDDAGRREPCLERRSRAGSKFEGCDGGGVR